MEKGRAMANTVAQEVTRMIAAAWLILSSLLYSLQLNTGSFPKPLTEEEERHYLALAQQGDLEARNILIERNLRLVAHIMNKGSCARRVFPGNSGSCEFTYIGKKVSVFWNGKKNLLGRMCCDFLRCNKNEKTR